MTNLELMLIYERIVRENYNKFYKLNRFGKTFAKHKETFKKLNRILKDADIDHEDFIRVQFSNKGFKPFPNQLLGKDAMNRYLNHINTTNIKDIHYTQEQYLKDFMEVGYTIEEALALDVFYYYFRCMKLKNYPKSWNFKAKKEMDKLPGLKELINEM